MTRYDRTPIIPPASGFPRRPARRARRRIPQATIPIHHPGIPCRGEVVGRARARAPVTPSSLVRTRRRGQLLKARGGSISLATKATATPPLALLLLPSRSPSTPIPDGRREAGRRDDGGRRAAVARNGRRTHGFRARGWILRPETRPRLGAAWARGSRLAASASASARVCVHIYIQQQLTGVADRLLRRGVRAANGHHGRDAPRRGVRAAAAAPAGRVVVRRGGGAVRDAAAVILPVRRRP